MAMIRNATATLFCNPLPPVAASTTGGSFSPSAAPAAAAGPPGSFLFVHCSSVLLLDVQWALFGQAAGGFRDYRLQVTYHNLNMTTAVLAAGAVALPAPSAALNTTNAAIVPSVVYLASWQSAVARIGDMAARLTLLCLFAVFSLSWLRSMLWQPRLRVVPLQAAPSLAHAVTGATTHAGFKGRPAALTPAASTQGGGPMAPRGRVQFVRERHFVSPRQWLPQQAWVGLLLICLVFFLNPLYITSTFLQKAALSFRLATAFVETVAWASIFVFWWTLVDSMKVPAQRIVDLEMKRPQRSADAFDSARYFRLRHMRAPQETARARARTRSESESVASDSTASSSLGLAGAMPPFFCRCRPCCRDLDRGTLVAPPHVSQVPPYSGAPSSARASFLSPSVASEASGVSGRGSPAFADAVSQDPSSTTLGPSAPAAATAIFLRDEGSGPGYGFNDRIPGAAVPRYRATSDMSVGSIQHQRQYNAPEGSVSSSTSPGKTIASSGVDKKPDTFAMTMASRRLKERRYCFCCMRRRRCQWCCYCPWVCGWRVVFSPSSPLFDARGYPYKGMYFYISKIAFFFLYIVVGAGLLVLSQPNVLTMGSSGSSGGGTAGFDTMGSSKQLLALIVLLAGIYLLLLVFWVCAFISATVTSARQLKRLPYSETRYSQLAFRLFLFQQLAVVLFVLTVNATPVARFIRTAITHPIVAPASSSTPSLEAQSLGARSLRTFADWVLPSAPLHSYADFADSSDIRASITAQVVSIVRSLTQSESVTPLGEVILVCCYVFMLAYSYSPPRVPLPPGLVAHSEPHHLVGGKHLSSSTSLVHQANPLHTSGVSADLPSPTNDLGAPFIMKDQVEGSEEASVSEPRLEGASSHPSSKRLSERDHSKLNTQQFAQAVGEAILNAPSAAVQLSAMLGSEIQNVFDTLFLGLPDAADHRFCLATCCWLFDFANAVYFDPPNVQTASSFGPVDGAPHGFTIVSVVVDVDTDTVAWVCVKDHRVVLAFRGTSSQRNVSTDLKFSRGAVHFGEDDSEQGIRERSHEGFTARAGHVATSLTSAIPGVRQALPLVHQGFWTAYSSVRRSVIAAVRSALAEAGANAKLYITGHSLGGALAQLAAFDLEPVVKENAKAIRRLHASLTSQTILNSVASHDSYANKFAKALGILKHAESDNYVGLQLQSEPNGLESPPSSDQQKPKMTNSTSGISLFGSKTRRSSHLLNNRSALGTPSNVASYGTGLDLTSANEAFSTSPKGPGSHGAPNGGDDSVSSNGASQRRVHFSEDDEAAAVLLFSEALDAAETWDQCGLPPDYMPDDVDIANDAEGLPTAGNEIENEEDASVFVYTFGQPRLGNPTFSRMYNRRVPDSFRLVTDGDLVTGIPRGLFSMYKHAGIEVWVDEYGNIIVSPSFVERAFRASSRTSIIAHKMATYRKGLLRARRNEGLPLPPSTSLRVPTGAAEADASMSFE
jgi:hypothetical protein